MLQPLNWACKVLEGKEKEDSGERLLYARPTHTHGHMVSSQCMVTWSQPTGKEAGKCSLAVCTGRLTRCGGLSLMQCFRVPKRTNKACYQCKLYEEFCDLLPMNFICVAECGLGFAFIVVYNLVEKWTVCMYLSLLGATMIEPKSLKTKQSN